MYVCICHALRERDVEDALGQGACRISEIYRHFGVRPQCGRCLSTLRHLLVAHHGPMHPAQRRQAEPIPADGHDGTHLTLGKNHR